MGEVAVQYEEMFTMSGVLEWEDIVRAIDKVVTPDMNRMLTCPFTAMEVQQAAFQMHPSKAPGPDGMSSFFFQKYWHIVGQDVVTAVLSVLNSGFSPRKVNHSHIVLVPKKKNPNKCQTIDLLAYLMWCIRFYPKFLIID